MPKRSKRSSLPKSPQKGDKITIVYWGTLAQGSVRRAAGGRNIEYRARVRNTGGTFTRVGGTVRRNTEGVDWVRGWDTPDANALGTALAFKNLDVPTR